MKKIIIFLLILLVIENNFYSLEKSISQSDASISSSFNDSQKPLNLRQKVSFIDEKLIDFCQKEKPKKLSSDKIVTTKFEYPKSSTIEIEVEDKENKQITIETRDIKTNELIHKEIIQSTGLYLRISETFYELDGSFVTIFYNLNYKIAPNDKIGGQSKIREEFYNSSNLLMKIDKYDLTTREIYQTENYDINGQLKTIKNMIY